MIINLLPNFFTGFSSAHSKTRQTMMKSENCCEQNLFHSNLRTNQGFRKNLSIIDLSDYPVCIKTCQALICFSIKRVCVKCIVGKVGTKQAKQAEICGVCFCIFFIILEGQRKAKQRLIFPTINKAKQAKQGQFNLFYYKGKVGKVEACSYLFLAKQSRQSRDLFFQL